MTVIKCPSCQINTSLKRRDYLGNCQCRGCGKLLSVKISGNIVQKVLLTDCYVNLSASVPGQISDDFHEAVTCFNAQAYRACAVMCRRSVEALANIQKAKGRTIQDKLEDLKNRNVIDQTTFNLASGIRQFGGYGAHPQIILFRNVDRGQADIVLKVTEQLVNYIYP